MKTELSFFQQENIGYIYTHNWEKTDELPVTTSYVFSVGLRTLLWFDDSKSGKFFPYTND